MAITILGVNKYRNEKRKKQKMRMKTEGRKKGKATVRSDSVIVTSDDDNLGHDCGRNEEEKQEGGKGRWMRTNTTSKERITCK
jgi:hypothetical protein